TLVPDQRIVGGRLADHDRARLAEQLRLGELLRADAAALFRGGEHDHHAGRAGKLLRHAPRRDQDRPHPGLHVRAAAAVELVARRLAGERIVRPLAGAERDHVEMAGEAERLLRVATAATGDDAGAAVGVLVVLDLVAPLLEHRAGVMRAIALAAG